MVDSDSDVDLSLLESLMEAAENTEKDKPKSDSRKTDFSSILENLDEIPVKIPSTSKLSTAKQESSEKVSGGTSSLIHAGDTDSDDDDDKYFHKKQYNEYGSSVKKLLQPEEPSPGFGFQGSSSGTSKSWRSTQKAAPGTLCVPAAEVKPSSDLNIDSLVGVRVTNPLVSSLVLSERLKGRKVVPFSNLKTFIGDGKTKEDWVIVGAIVSKSPPRTSAKGSTYSIIRLSDLRGLGDLKTVSVFLFSSACKTHGKNSVGTVLGILNPGMFDNSKSHGDQACVSVDSADKIMVLGASKDFAFCKSKKKNGENCTSFVNKANCEFCIYHIKQEYQQCSRRSELQASFNGKGLLGGLTGLRNKVLGKSEVFYGGQSFTAIPAKKSNKIAARDNQRLSVLSGAVAASVNSPGRTKNRLAASVELSHRQAQKDLDRLHKLAALDTNRSIDTNQRPALGASSNYSQELKLEEVKNDSLTFISKARELSASKGPEALTENVTLTNERSMKKQISDPILPSKPAEMSRGAAFAFAATHKKVESKSQPSAFGLGNKFGPKISNSENSSPTRKPISVPSCQRNSSPLTVAEEKCEQKIKTVSKKDVNDLAVQKNPTESKILSKLIEKRGTKSIPPVQVEPVGPTIIKASEFGLGRGKRVVPEVGLNKSVPSLTKSVPTLGAGISPLGKIVFDLSISPQNYQSAKLKALSYVRRNGSITKDDPNKLELSSKKKVVSSDKQQPKKRKVVEVLEASGTSKKKIKSEEEERHKQKMAEFKALMEVSSKHVDLVVQADNEAQDDYFDKLEKKERLEEKMLNTYKVPCKAVTCSRCKYTAFSAADVCKEERHPLKVHDATKRFFKCGDCGNRTCCLEIIPLKTCTNCNSSKWERAAMIRDKKVGIGSETLSIRGGEEKFIGSVVTGANLNLLVPD